MSNPLVKIEQGSLNGAFVDGELGQFMTFRGIPYAEPPVGKLRFKDPQPPKSWGGIRDAKNEGNVPPQFGPQINQFIGQDDCLFINVSTNNLTELKPVMVWIYGGGFTNGSGNADFYRPDYFMQHDVVFVSFNYRLGMLGFLNMDMEDCSGNQGLKDQVLALKWVQKNIGAFGGDKNNVTIFGESAGSASVHYLCISPLAKGLFHKAIAQSGVVINPWAHQTSNKEYAIKVATELGCSSSNNEEIVQFLRTKPIEEILKTQYEIFDIHPLRLDFHFVPSVDNKCPNPFLPKPLSEMIESGIDVPLIIGYTSDEGMVSLGSPEFNNEEKISKFITNFEENLCKDLKINSSVASKFSNDVKQFYYGDDSIYKTEHDKFVQFKGDVLFASGVWHIVEKQLQKKTPIYLYKFSHSPEFSLVKMFFQINTKGACHADDMTHLFYKALLPQNMQLQKGTKDYLIMEHMTRMWTDFAKTGNPTPKIDDLIKSKWSSYNSDKKCCQHIVDNFNTEDNFIENSWKLWKSIYQKYKLF
ncbi:juvenile hormone esterase-like isoform X1 [Leptopilina boulardi]|uniref:juvenile hormone esterase-like isoform X1 n=1 Tax=Leptopilina boulardi TaxID=63433 RepID=UPI0021F52427|nr:juvenile hormone esterase-like isoform X1 [Leptopilina boulardi]